MFEIFDVPTHVIPEYKTWSKTVHPDDSNKVEPLLQGAVQGKAVFDTEFRIIHSSGYIKNIRAAARVITDSDNTPQSVTGLNWDVTESREAEEALRNSEEKVRLLLDSTGEAIYGIDLEGNCTFANPSCARMLGY